MNFSTILVFIVYAGKSRAALKSYNVIKDANITVETIGIKMVTTNEDTKKTAEKKKKIKNALNFTIFFSYESILNVSPNTQENNR